MLLSFLFAFARAFLDRPEDLIPEPVILIPISVVLIGNHSLTHPNLSIIARKWFEGLGHVITQEIQESTDWYVSSNILNVPPLRYRLNFSFVDVREDDGIIFEKALSQLARNLTVPSKSGIVHPYPLGLLLQSLVDHYGIPNYVFFLFASKSKRFSICEGLHRNESETVANISEVELKLNRSRSWASEISLILKSRKRLLGNWGDGGSVRAHLEHLSELTCELKTPSTNSHCGKYWVLQNRILFADASVFARNAYLDLTASENEPTHSEMLADTESSYQKFCSTNSSSLSAFCTNLNHYLLYLQSFETETQPSSIILKRFLANSSAVLLDAVKSVLIPNVPAFETPIPDSFLFKIQIITANSTHSLAIERLTTPLKTYLMNRTTGEFEFETAKLTDFPSIAFELSRFDEYGKIAQSIRQNFEHIPAAHKLRSDLNRTVSIAIAIYESSNLLPFGNHSNSFAFDSVAFAIANSTSFDPLPLLRSCLIHMYGIRPSRQWRSLSILSPASCHSELSVVSRDAAYRNSARVELVKTRRKVAHRISDIVDFINFASANLTISRFDGILSGHLNAVKRLSSDVVSVCSALHFDRLTGVVNALRVGRRTFSREAKDVLNGLQDEVCEYAPVDLIVKNLTVVDWMDRIAVLTAGLWMTLLAASGVVLVFAVRKSLKRD